MLLDLCLVYSLVELELQRMKIHENIDIHSFLPFYDDPPKIPRQGSNPGLSLTLSSLLIIKS